VIHGLQDFPLILLDRAQPFAQEQAAIAAQGRQVRVERPSQKIRAVMVVFLQLQVGLNQALQNLVALGAERTVD
jgi:hypothetical protein